MIASRAGGSPAAAGLAGKGLGADAPAPPHERRPAVHVCGNSTQPQFAEALGRPQADALLDQQAL